MEKTHIKCYLNTSEIRRFDFNPDDQFEALLAKIRSTYQGFISDRDTLQLYWLDEENEQIGLTSTAELNYAIQYLKTLQLSPFKVLIYKLTNKGKKAEVKAPKIAKTTPVPIKPVVCTGCDQSILNDSFKSYVFEDSLCKKCSEPGVGAAAVETTHEPLTSNQQTSPTKADFKKTMDNLRKKVNKELNTIYLKNFKHLIPNYKMSDLSKQESNTQTVLPTTEEVINEEFKKLEEVNEAISQMRKSNEDLNKLDEVVIASTSGQQDNNHTAEILTDQKLADIFLTLNAMGLEDDEDGCLKTLVIEKKGDISATVEAYFDLCFQKIIREASNEKRNSGFVGESVAKN